LIMELYYAVRIIRERTEKLDLKQDGASRGKGSGDDTTGDSSVVDVLRELAARVECLGGCMNQLDTHVGQLGGTMDELTGRMLPMMCRR